jgi:hypothetical protein
LHPNQNQEQAFTQSSAQKAAHNLVLATGKEQAR